MKRTRTDSQTLSMTQRIDSLDWARIESDLDSKGYALAGRVLEPTECETLAAMYPERERFRNRIVMERLRYGVGEYKYFARPLPEIIETARTALYGHLVPLANRWAELLGDDTQYPATLACYLELCHEQGQERPTPLLLRYQAGGYNCLHQDLYGELAFPLQFTCALSRRGRDFEGGELLLVEQRPRAQSRGEAIALDQGEAIIFPNRYRPVAGTRGHHRVAVRHGVSTIRTGERFALGIIFHDAK
ncbi:MAG TPA: 2OG-Fe(II) oxygenase [Candidatus Binataceae bacterium]|nr:2OG-Fe(II) oxygenase [Candidatus Binataceae bacterium]